MSFRRFGEERHADDDARRVFIRVIAPDSTHHDAVTTARRTVDALAGLASLHGTPPRLWELDDSFMSLTPDGVGAGALFSAPQATQLSLEDSMALRSDHTAQALADMADRLASVLPVRDSAIRHAAMLLKWLRGARLAAGPALAALRSRGRAGERLGRLRRAPPLRV